MLLSPNPLYKAYWVAQCRYTRNGEQFKGVMTVAGTSQSQAIKQMRQYFTAHPGEYTFADYDTLIPLITHIEQSSTLELPLIRQVREQHNAKISAVLVDKCNLTHPRPSEKGDIHYREGQPTFIEYSHLYVVIDSGEYHRQTGQHLVPKLHGSQLPWKSLYQGETQDSLEDKAPYLVHIVANQAGQRFLAHYLNLPHKASLGLFINSLKPFTDIHRQMRKLTYLYNQKLESWNFFRFYDVKHFIPFIESLTHGQLINVVNGVNAFYGYSAQYPDGVEITFHPDYLYDGSKREPLFINTYLYNHYANITQMQTVAKAKALIEQFSQVEGDELEGDALMGYCIHAANYSFLDDIHQSKALLYDLQARYLCRHQPRTWQIANEKAAPYKYNQVLLSYHRYIACLNTQGEMK